MDGAEAGPSASIAGPSREISDADLAAADNDFEAGMQALRENDMSQAVDKFAAALEVRVARYGGMALECASAYYRYGAALFDKAKEESDVLGGPLQQAARDERVALAASKTEPEDADAEKENIDDKGKKPMESPGEAVGEDTDDEEAGDGDEEDKGEDAETDMQLAWQMLEIARTIYQQDVDKYAAELADVHLLLGDINMEEETFTSASTEYETALQYSQRVSKEPNRLTAEIQYKIALALQYLNEPDKALVSCRAALATCQNQIAYLKTLCVAAPQTLDTAAMPEGNETAVGAGAVDGEAAPENAMMDGQEALPEVDNMDVAEPVAATTASPKELDQEAIEKEISDLEAVSEDLTEKLQELCEAVALFNSQREAVKSAFSQLSSLMNREEPGEQTTAFGSRPSGAPVQDLGVVGRGSKRIQLQPQGGGVPSAPVLSDGAAVPATKPKRSLEDLMGDPAGETTVGFGPAPEGVAAPKKLRIEAQENSCGNVVTPAPCPAPTKAALPAFLQPANIAAVYGSAPSAEDVQPAAP